MNPTYKKSPGARGISEPFSRPTAPAMPTRPVVAQLKTGVSAQSVKQPVAPPVYRPQPTPKVMQRKMANVTANRAPMLALPVRSSPPLPHLLTSAVSPFQGVVQRARKKEKKGPTPEQLYTHAEIIIVGYGMDPDYLRWLAIGRRTGYHPPDLTGFHASKPGQAGAKAEKERHKRITPILTAWKKGLKEDLKISHGIDEQALGKIEDALTAKGL